MLISFHPEIRISKIGRHWSTLKKGPHPGTGWEHLDFRMELLPETLFQSVDFIDLNRSSAKPSGRVSGHK
jgi:hypothetical protein